MDQQPGHFQEVALLRQIFNGIAGVAQHSPLAIQEGDLAVAGTGVSEARVDGDRTGLSAQLPDVDVDLALRPHQDWKLNLLLAQGQTGYLGNGMHSGLGHGGILRPHPIVVIKAKAGEMAAAQESCIPAPSSPLKTSTSPVRPATSRMPRGTCNQGLRVPVLWI